MAWPGTLSTDEQTSLQEWMQLFRASCGEVARINNHLGVVNDEYNGPQNNSTGNLSKLADSDVIPNASGLAGAENMTKAEVLTVLSYMQAFLAYNSSAHRQNLAKGCGESNLIG